MSGVSTRQAALLVGGRGTRLGGLTANIPKPLVPICGRPFLDWQIEEIARHGFERITLLAGYKGEQIAARYDGGTVRGAKLEVLVEPDLLGTAGSVKFFSGYLHDQFLLLNGDTLFGINLLDLPLRVGQALATLALRRAAPGHRYDTVVLTDDGTITGFLPRSDCRGKAINGGVYAVDRSIVDWIGDGPISLEADVFPRLAAAGLLRGTLYDDAFIDIGIPEDLERAQTMIPAMHCRPAAFLDRDGVLIVDDGYPHDPTKVQWIPGVASGIKKLNDNGYYVFVVSNQAGVGRGYYSEGQVIDLHRWMAEQLAAQGAHVDSWQYCPHHPEHGLMNYRRDCYRRKPRSGMITDVLVNWSIDRTRSFLVGDKRTDLVAATGAGIPGYLFRGGSLDAFLNRVLQ